MSRFIHGLLVFGLMAIAAIASAEDSKDEAIEKHLADMSRW